MTPRATMADERCDNCRFWSLESFGGDPVGGNSGECRRRSPRLVMAMTPLALAKECTQAATGPDPEEMARDSSRGVFPLTYAWNWCGEWQAASSGPG